MGVQIEELHKRLIKDPMMTQPWYSRLNRVYRQAYYARELVLEEEARIGRLG